MARATKLDTVRELQRTLYRAVKADPGRRFHALYDKVYRRDVLERAWELVRANKGAAGVDQQTITDVEEYGVARLLDELTADLKQGRWRLLPARRVYIPKRGRPTEQRPLSIPAVRDRVVQAAARLVIEPIFDHAAHRIREDLRDRSGLDPTQVVTLTAVQELEHEHQATLAQPAGQQSDAAAAAQDAPRAFDDPRRREQLRARLAGADVPEPAIEARTLADLAQAREAVEAARTPAVAAAEPQRGAGNRSPRELARRRWASGFGLSRTAYPARLALRGR